MTAATTLTRTSTPTEVQALQGRLDNGTARRWTDGPFHHQSWCDPSEHAAYAAETGWDDLCAGSKMAESYAGERHHDGSPVEVRGQWREPVDANRAWARFEVDPVGDLTWYGVEKLLSYLDGVEAPRAVALRALLTRGLAEVDAACPLPSK